MKVIFHMESYLGSTLPQVVRIQGKTSEISTRIGLVRFSRVLLLDSKRLIDRKFSAVIGQESIHGTTGVHITSVRTISERS